MLTLIIWLARLYQAVDHACPNDLCHYEAAQLHNAVLRALIGS